ncbi:hypothetical protein ACJRO7_034540 [Eucalyptus globulus]|uniref:Phosphoglycerate mutase n=1 Tax=Eucalyptus globulus TaxID=34317 RepID=A0ABD3J445_EUCGL
MSGSNSNNGNAQSVPIGVAYGEIFVVYHGETEWNADGGIQGYLYIKLNEIGRRQATAVGERLSREGKISTIYSSGLKRALETANLIAIACGGLENLRYQGSRSTGKKSRGAQGLGPPAAARICPEAFKVLRSRKMDREIPGGGESIDPMCLRNISMKHKAGERLIVVIHDCVIQSLHKQACPNKPSGKKVLNTSVNIFHLFDGDNWVLKS